MEQYQDEVWCCEIWQDAKKDLVCGNQAQNATKSHTRSGDAQDAQDANLTSLASGCKADMSDAPYNFADHRNYLHRRVLLGLPLAEVVVVFHYFLLLLPWRFTLVLGLIGFPFL